jgi:hypothetical protein
MMPDSPKNQHALPRGRVVEVIERSTADALRQLRAAGIPETEALAVIQRFSALSIQVLRELDHLYREYEQLLAHDPDRSQAHQEWLDTKAGGVLLTIEAFIAALVAEAINKAKEDYRSELSKPQPVITVPAKPSRPAQLAVFLTTWALPVWLIGLLAGGLLAYQSSGSILWAGIGVLIAFVLWRMVGRFWWGLSFPSSALA